MKKLLGFLLIGLLLWIAYWIGAASYYPNLQQRGLFGDSFGAFSSLATALAFAGTAYAIYQQDKTSSQQELQIRIQADLEARTAIALERNSTIELVRVLEAMRSDNAKQITTWLMFVKQHSTDTAAQSAVAEAKASLKKLFHTQELLNKSHHRSLESLVSAWGLEPQLAESLIALTGENDYSKWNDIVESSLEVQTTIQSSAGEV